MSNPLNILQIAPRVPWPPTDGGAIGIYNITRFVAARGHRITFVAFGAGRGGEERRGAGRDMSAFCRLEIVDHDTRNRVFGAMINLFSREPYSISKSRCAAMFARIDALCAEHTFDVVHVDHVHMAMYGEYIQQRYGIPYVLREHNFEATILRRFAEHSRLPLIAPYLRMQAARLYRYEIAALEFPDVIAAITAEDARDIRIGAKRNVEGRAGADRNAIHLIPAGVDVEQLRPFADQPTDAHVVIVGPLHWSPNLDAALWFCNDIWPRIRTAVPGARCTIAGAQPTARLQRMAGDGISVPGFVDDFSELLASARVLAVPLRVGGGMRIKLLEFFAHGKAVVSTSIGAEGNLARDGIELLLADDADTFADAVVRVLKNSDLAMTLGSSARLLAEQQYAWPHIASLFESAYRLAIKKKPQKRE